MGGNNVLSEGIALYKKGDYAASLAFFLSIPDGSKVDDMELSYYIGLCYARLHRHDDALLYLEQVVTGDKNEKRVLQCRFILAIIYCQSDRKRLADFELKKLLETGYKSSSVYAALGYIAWENNQIEQSIEYYHKALGSDPNNPTALNGLGFVLACENRDLAKALAYCKRALEIIPTSAALLDSVGWVYYKLGMMEDSIKYLKQAMEIDGDNNEILAHYRQVSAQFQ